MNATSQQQRRIVVVGSGFIGTRVAARAAARDLPALLYGRRAPDTTIGFEFERGDATDEGIADLLQPGDQVVFAAGTSRPADSDEAPIAEFDRNLSPLLNVLAAVEAIDDARFTLISSGGTVYGATDELPTSEQAPTWPRSTYGVVKLAAEKLVAMHAARHGFAADILRCSNVYGPGQPSQGSQGLIGILLERIASGEPVVVYGDGTARRDYLHVDDLADVIFDLGAIGSGVRVLNVGSGVSHTVVDVVERAARACSRTPNLQFRPSRSTDVAHVELDISRLRAILDFRPRSLDEGLSTVVAAPSGGAS